MSVQYGWPGNCHQCGIALSGIISANFPGCGHSFCGSCLLATDGDTCFMCNIRSAGPSGWPV